MNVQISSPLAQATHRAGSSFERLVREISATLSGPGWVPYLIWVAYSSYVFLHAESAVPDERFFVLIAGETSFWKYLSEAPLYNYGSIFWIGLKLLHSAFAARFVMLIMFVLTPYLVIRTISAPRMKLAVLLLWLSFPVAWWTGKLIAPEIPTMFLAALALYAFDRGRLVACAACLGCAVGAKLSALPILVFFVLQFALHLERPLRIDFKKTSMVVLAFVLATFVACPPILKVVHELRQQPVNAMPVDLDRAMEVLLSNRWEWDAVFSGGVLRFSLMPYPLLVVALVVLVRDARTFAAFAVTAAGFLWLNAHNANYYGWYWITLFPVVLYAISRPGKRYEPGAFAFLVACAAAGNAIQQLPLISDQVYQKAEQIRVLAKRDDITACIQQKLGEIKPATIFNRAESGLELQNSAQVFGFPEPAAYDAQVQLIGVRHMVAGRQGRIEGLQDKKLYAICDGVMIFTKN